MLWPFPAPDVCYTATRSQYKQQLSTKIKSHNTLSENGLLPHGEEARVIISHRRCRVSDFSAV